MLSDRVRMLNNTKKIKIRYIRNSQLSDYYRPSQSTRFWSEMAVFAGDVNLSKGTPAHRLTSDIPSLAYPLTNIVDGDLATRTQGNHQIFNEYKYVQIDLGKVYTDVDRIFVYNYVRTDASWRIKWKLEVSENEIDWITIYDWEIDGLYQETSSGRYFAI